MNALVISEPGKTAIIELPRPVPGRDEVLLKVRRVGFCGSDLSTFRGLNPLVSFPRIPGHEIAGIIVQKGAEVPSEISDGLATTALPYTACGACPSCRAQRANACQSNQTLGVQRDGAMAEYVVLRWTKLIWSRSLSFAEHALIEPLSVGFHAVKRGRVCASDTVLVFGCGMIGLGAISGAKLQVGARVIAVDVDDSKLALAKQCGADITINSMREELVECCRAATAGEGPSVVIEAVGLPQTFRAAVDLVAYSGRVVYIGYAKESVAYETKYFVMKELDILGSRNATIEDFKAAREMLEAGRYPVAATISQVVGLAGAGAALAEWATAPGRITKIQVEF